MTCDKELHNALLAMKNGKPWLAHKHLVELLKNVEVAEIKKEGTRSNAQNRSIHLWLTQVAEELDRHGHTVQNVTSKIQRAEIRPTGENLKEILWRPYMIASTRKESTTQLNKSEVDRVYEGLNKFLGDHFGIHIPFPSNETRAWEELSGEKLGAHNNLSKVNYPDYDEEPTI